VSVAKRHHTVPQFYLRGFARNEQIGTIRLPGDRRFVQSIRRAASETNFYAVDGFKDGTDVFEKVLAKIEGDVATVFEEIENGRWPLNPESRLRLAQFIALQAIRGPDQRRNMQHLVAQMTRLEIGFGGRSGVRKWAERKKGIVLTEEQAELLWDQATRPEGPPISITPIVHIRQIAELLEALLPYVVGRPWSLIRFNKRALITSDSPVALIPHPDDETSRGVGFMTAWGVSYPLSRRLGLLLSDPMPFADAMPVERVRAGILDNVQVGTKKNESFQPDARVVDHARM